MYGSLRWGLRTSKITLSRQVARKNCPRYGKDAASIDGQSTDDSALGDLGFHATYTIPQHIRRPRTTFL